MIDRSLGGQRRELRAQAELKHGWQDFRQGVGVAGAQHKTGRFGDLEPFQRRAFTRARGQGGDPGQSDDRRYGAFFKIDFAIVSAQAIEESQRGIKIQSAARQMGQKPSLGFRSADDFF